MSASVPDGSATSVRRAPAPSTLSRVRGKAETGRRALGMGLLYANCVEAYRNRLASYETTGPEVTYRLRNRVALVASPGPHDVKVINEIWLSGEYRAPGFVPQQGWRVVDIGANKGYFAAWVLHSDPGTHVDCYEPNPRSAAILRRNLAAWSDDRHTVTEAAVGPDEAEVTLYHVEGRDGQNSLYRRRAATSGRVTGSSQVPMVGLGDALGGNRVDLLKLDVEGAEYEIILGAPDGAFDGVQRIVAEADRTDPSGSERSIADLADRLVRDGFRRVEHRRHLLFFEREV